MENKADWFDSWFNTPYYHVLYNHRNDNDAQVFMQNLVSFLKLSLQQSIIDLACGKGRHSIYLNSLGYQVTGMDLSKESILHASKFANEHLHFKVQDMRFPLQHPKVDAVFNLFTSFGYFENDEEDIAVLHNIHNVLKTNGIAVIDFLNVNKVIPNLVPSETITKQGLTFHISRAVVDGFITKNIEFTDHGKNYHFTERVKALTLEKFINYTTKANLKINHIFGDYQLNPYQPETSDRLILILTT